MIPRTHFEPGGLFPDNNGVHLNAHGAGALFHDGVYYLYGEHKIAGPEGNTAQVGVSVYSSTDLLTWTDRGIALDVADVPGHDIERGSVIERPKVIFNARTGKFVMWFHLELKGHGYHAARTASAVGDSPIGPFVFQRSLRPNAGIWPIGYTGSREIPTTAELDALKTSPDFRAAVVDGIFLRRDVPGGQMARDMTLFVDDDAKAYLIASAEENFTLNIHALTDDYLDFTGVWARILPGGHNEAPAICKHNGTYHLLTSGCTGWEPNAARACVARHVLGPWTEVENPCVGVNPANGFGPEMTFGGQSTFILPVAGRRDAFIAMFDVWRPKNPIDGGYLWLPIEFKNDRMIIAWRDRWDLSVFDR